MSITPKFFVVAVHPDGSRERVICGKAKHVKPFAKKIALEHARTYYSIHHLSTVIEEDLTSNKLIAEYA